MNDQSETSFRPRDELDQRLATLWRVESPRMIARLMRQLGDLDSAEEIAQDAFMAAIEKWPQDGVPDNPAAWLNTTARYLAVDRIRRRDTQRDANDELMLRQNHRRFKFRDQSGKPSGQIRI